MVCAMACGALRRVRSFAGSSLRQHALNPRAFAPQRLKRRDVVVTLHETRSGPSNGNVTLVQRTYLVAKGMAVAVNAQR